MVNYAKIAVRGVAFIFVVSIITAVLGYAVRVILARNLSLEEFGLFYAVFAFLNLFGFFESLGFDKALVRYIPEFRNKKNEDMIKSSLLYVVIINFVVYSVIAAICFIFADILAEHYFKDARASLVLKFMVFAFFLNSIALIIKFAFQGFRRMGYYASMDLVRMVLLIALILAGFSYGTTLMAPVIAYAMVPAILIICFGLLFTRSVFRKFFAAKFTYQKEKVRGMTSYSFYVFIGSIAGIILGSTDMVMITYFLGLTSVALYAVALPTTKALSFFSQSIARVLFPLSSELWFSKQHLTLKAGMVSLYKYSILIILPMSIVLFSYAEFIITVLFGEEFLSAALAMKILSIGMIFATLSQICNNFFMGIGEARIPTTIAYVGAAFNIIANLILIPIIGIAGAAITTACGYFIMMVLALLRVRKFLEIPLPLMNWTKTAVAGALFLGSIHILETYLALNVWVELAVVGLISSLVYLCCLFLFKVIRMDEIKKIYKDVFSS